MDRHAEQCGLDHGSILEGLGQRIPPEIRPSLFKPYVSTKARGTGMGLALTEKLVGQHGGRIDFQTGPRGTTFRITLPLQPPAEARGNP